MIYCFKGLFCDLLFQVFIMWLTVPRVYYVIYCSNGLLGDLLFQGFIMWFTVSRVYYVLYYSKVLFHDLLFQGFNMWFTVSWVYYVINCHDTIETYYFSVYYASNFVTLFKTTINWLLLFSFYASFHTNFFSLLIKYDFRSADWYWVIIFI